MYTVQSFQHINFFKEKSLEFFTKQRFTYGHKNHSYRQKSATSTYNINVEVGFLLLPHYNKFWSADSMVLCTNYSAGFCSFSMLVENDSSDDIVCQNLWPVCWYSVLPCGILSACTVYYHVVFCLLVQCTTMWYSVCWYSVLPCGILSACTVYQYLLSCLLVQCTISGNLSAGKLF